MPVPCAGRAALDRCRRFSRAQSTYTVLDLLPTIWNMALLTTIAKLAVMRIFTGMACDACDTHQCCVLAFWRRMFVATFTRHFTVRAFQPVGGPSVVVEIPDRPGTGVMTVFAAHSELLFVFVFIFMTRKAIFRCVFVTECFVTILTRCGDMTPCQRKARPRMVELSGLPGPVAMALFTLGTQLILVLIVFLVAADAVERSVAVTAKIFVTSVTFNFRISMPIAQFESRLVMVEAPLGTFPVAFSMALTAFFTQVADMLVVFLVAANALFGRLFEHRALVALLALRFGVLAQQGERRCLMVKLGRLLPVALGVTVSAFLAQ